MERLTDEQRAAVRAYNLAAREKMIKKTPYIKWHKEELQLLKDAEQKLSNSQYQYWFSFEMVEMDYQNTWQNLTL